MTRIVEIVAREILDSQGSPTVEAEVELECGARGKAAAPSAAAVGKHDAVYLYDEDEDRYGGRGVLKAIKNVHQIIGPKLKGMDALSQRHIDSVLRELDGTENMEKLGANALLAVSLAVARAAAEALGLPLYRYLGGVNAHVLPAPMMGMLVGGDQVDIRELMVVPLGAPNFSEALRMGAEIHHALERVLTEKELGTAVAPDGSFKPNAQSNDECIQAILAAIEQAKYRPGDDVALALAMAGDRLYRDGNYVLSAPESAQMDVDGMVEFYTGLVDAHPIRSIEDPFASEDWDAWKKLTAKIGDRVQVAGSDLYASNPGRISRGIRNRCSNSALIRARQIGTLSQTLEAIETAQTHGMAAVLSHCSGETQDTTIADIAVATNAGQIKTGPPCRTDRASKYNRLLRIEEELGDASAYGPISWKKQ